MEKGRGINPLPFYIGNQQQPQLLPKPLPHRSSSTMIIQQQSPLLPHPQLLPPQLLLPHKAKRMMIHRMQLQLLCPKPNHPLEQLLSHPHLSHLSSEHPQFVAAKSLIEKSSRNCFTLHTMNGTGRELQWKRLTHINNSIII